MLIIEDRSHFENVVEHAKKIGMYDGEENGCLKKKLDYLEKYRSGTARVRLYKDFAPFSFGFTIEIPRGDEWVHLFDGGLVFHGSHDGFGSGGAPTYSVALAATVGWSIHT